MRIARGVGLGLAVLLAGCTTSIGTLPLAAHATDIVGTKMLAPGATGRSCGTDVLGIPIGKRPDIDAALRQILEFDAEGNVVLDATVSRFDLVTILVNRRCIEVHGDLARMTPSMVLPTHHEPGHHH